MYNYTKQEYKDYLDSLDKTKIKKIERTANRVAKTKIVINLNKNSSDCFCGPKKNFHYIQLGAQIGLIGAQKTSLNDYFFKLIGAVSHEAGHARFTDFTAAKTIGEAAEKAQDNVKKIAQEWLDTGNDDLFKDIEEEVYNYVYNVHLFSMYNSYEDAYIESEIIRHCSKIPLVYTGLSKLREDTTDLEDEGHRHMIDNNQMDKKSNDYIKAIMTDMRHMAVIGYKNYPCEYAVLDYHGFTNDEFQEMMDIAMYARLGSHNSMDVLAAARTAMKFIDDLIRNVAKDYSDKYLEALQKQKSSGDDDAPEFDNSDFSSEADEMAISKKMAGSNPGASHQREPEFNLELPSDVEEEIQNNGGNTSSSGGSGQSNSNGSSSNGNSESNDGSNSQGSSESSNSSNQSNSSADSNGSNSDSSDNENQSGENSGEGSSNSSNNDSEGNETSENNALNGQTESNPEQAMKNLQKQLEAESSSASKKALSESMAELNKMKKTASEEAMKQAVGGPGKAPKLEQNLGNIDSISDMHKGIEVNYFSPKYWEKENLNFDISSQLSLASRYANKLKKVLFAETRDRKIRNLDRGHVDKKNLHHIITDGKCCYKKLEGKKNTARFCILVDQSGSMSGSKVKDAFIATKMLVQVARKIHVPVAVFGHNTGWDDVNLYHYLDYKSPKSMEDNLVHILDAGGSNHDSIPIFQCLTDMARNKKDNEKDIFIVISDGAPAGCNNYYGQPAFEDISNIYTMFEKKYGIKTIGIGIGDDVECVPEIYKHFIMIPDTEELPQALLDLLKKEIK